MNAFRLIFKCQRWSNRGQNMAKMTKSKINFFFLNSCFDWSNGLKTHKNKVWNVVKTCGQPHPELNQGKVVGLKLWPHLAECGRGYKNYIFVSFKGSTSLMNAFRLIFQCQRWSNRGQNLVKMTKSKINFFSLNSCFDWSDGLKTHKNKVWNVVATCGQPQSGSKPRQSHWAQTLAALSRLWPRV